MIESNEISFPPVGAAFPCQTDYSSVRTTRHNTHVVSEGLLHSGPICSLKEKIKAARGLDDVTARVQPSPSVPPSVDTSQRSQLRGISLHAGGSLFNL